MADSIKNDGGVHGSWHMFASNNLHKEMLKNNGNQRFIKLRYVISRIFADKNTMLKSYPILKKHVILMPICWMHRLGYVIFKNSSKLVDEIKGIIKTDIK